MTAAKYVLAIELLHPEGQALLDRRPNVRYRVIPDLAEAELAAEVGSADAIIVRNTRITEAAHQYLRGELVEVTARATHRTRIPVVSA